MMISPQDKVDEYIDANGDIIRVSVVADTTLYHRIVPGYILPQLHRIDGPAIICIKGDRAETWYYSGQIHRIDGPAYILGGYEEYWLYGVRRDGYLSWLEESGIDINNLTPEDKVLIDLRWKK